MQSCYSCYYISIVTVWFSSLFFYVIFGDFHTQKKWYPAWLKCKKKQDHTLTCSWLLFISSILRYCHFILHSEQTMRPRNAKSALQYASPQSQSLNQSITFKCFSVLFKMYVHTMFYSTTLAVQGQMAHPFYIQHTPTLYWVLWTQHSVRMLNVKQPPVKVSVLRNNLQWCNASQPSSQCSSYL